jgi:hypothetical protein
MDRNERLRNFDDNESWLDHKKIDSASQKLTLDFYNPIISQDGN